MLRSLYKKINTARSISNAKVVRSSTSLLESTLFTGSKQEPTVLSEINPHLKLKDIKLQHGETSTPLEQ